MTHTEMLEINKGDRLEVWSHDNGWQIGTVTGKGTLCGSPSIWVAFDDNNGISTNVATGTQFTQVHFDSTDMGRHFKKHALF